MKKNNLFICLGIVVLGMVLGFAAQYFNGVVKIEPESGWQDAFWSRFQVLFVFAVLIERSVEVYLLAAGLNGDDRFAPQNEKQGKQASVPAAIAALTLSIFVALAGVRLISTLGVLDPSSSAFAKAIWFGADVLISAGLMAGGSALFHEVAEVLRGGIGNLGKNFTKAGAQAETMVASAYTINVTRNSADTGILEFTSGSVSLKETCWWDPNVKITAGRYTGCSKTRMNSKTDSVTGEKRPGIFLADAVVPGTDKHTIFIHEGKDPSWSDGCIVLKREKMIDMWNEIKPSDAKNVLVVIKDS